MNSIKMKTLTRAEALRGNMERLEALIGRIGYGLDQQEALTILYLFDQVSSGLSELESAGIRYPGEEEQLASASALYRQKAGLFLRDVGGLHALDEARKTRQPGSKQWWWYPDQVLASRRRANLNRLMKISGVILAVLALAFVVYRTFFQPDPETLASYRAQRDVEVLLQERRLDEALARIEDALVIAPDDFDLLLLKGVVLYMSGETDAADEAFAAAQDQTGDMETFYVRRAEWFIPLGELEVARRDVDAILARSSDSALGYYLLGNIYEASDEFERAIGAYEEANRLAEEQSQAQLVVMVRMRLANMLQGAPSP